MIKNKQYTLAADPLKKQKTPVAKAEVPFIDFSVLQNALAALEKSSNQLADAWTKAIASSKDHDALNKSLYQAEQQLLSVNGLPRRPWFKHTIYAPGFYTGYGVKTMPGIREAIEQRDWKEAQDQINIDAAAITKFAAYLDEAAKK